MDTSSGVVCGVVRSGVMWCGVVLCGAMWCGVAWRGVVQCGVVWCGVLWCGVRVGGVGFAEYQRPAASHSPAYLLEAKDFSSADPLPGLDTLASSMDRRSSRALRSFGESSDGVVSSERWQ